MHICEERDSLLKEFIDEYKHLEKLCSEIYGQQHGISQYISDMEQTPLYTAGKISGWDGDLNNLKRVRHLRNKMVHDVDDYDSVYEPEDLEFLRTFYQRIISQNDPLALRAQLTKGLHLSNRSRRRFQRLFRRKSQRVSSRLTMSLRVASPKRLTVMFRALRTNKHVIETTLT